MRMPSIFSGRNSSVRRGANHTAEFLNDHPGWFSSPWKTTPNAVQQASSLTGTPQEKHHTDQSGEVWLAVTCGEARGGR